MGLSSFASQHNCTTFKKKFHLLITIWSNVWHEKRVKSAAIEANVISLFERFSLYTTLPLEHRIQIKNSELIEKPTKEQIYLKKYKRIFRELSSNFNLFPTRNSQIFQFSAFKRKIHSKMKDLVNGNILIENNDDLIVDQKYAYSNGDR